MKRSLVAHLRCTGCRSPLRLREAATERSPAEVVEGDLICVSCGRTYRVSAGVPRMREALTADSTRPRTAASFGYLWTQSVPGSEAYGATDYHFAKMEK